MPTLLVNFLFVVSLGVVLPGAHCLEAILAGVLPQKQFDSTAVYDGDDSVYILGGTIFRGYNVVDLSEILKYNLTSQSVEVVGQFPLGRSSGHAVQDTLGEFYYFGGHEGKVPTRKVSKFTAEDPNPVDVHPLWSDQSNNHAFAFDQSARSAYFFGASSHDFIVKYDINTHMDEVVGTSNASWATAVWIGNSAFIFGGSNNGISSTIYQYTSSTGNFILRGELSRGVTDATAVAVGKYGYIIGGITDEEPFNQLLKVNTETMEHEFLIVEGFPPVRLVSTTAVYVEKLNRIYTFGGMVSGGETDSIFYIQL